MASVRKRCDMSSRACHSAQQVAGVVLILVGILLLCLFVPFEIWIAIVGVALILGGVLLRLL